MSKTSSRVSVVLVDDDPDFVSLFKKLLSSDARLEMVGYASDKSSGVEMACTLTPDIVVMDLNLSGVALDGIDAAKEIRRATGVKILLLTAYEEHETIIRASKVAFASGYIFKSHFTMIADVIHATATSNSPLQEIIRELVLSELTVAERGVFEDIMKGVSVGMQYQSPSTIANQKTSIFKKLGLRSTKELITVFSNW